MIPQIGMDVIKSVVLDVLTGKNIRSSTEILTRRRITALNLAILNLFIKGVASIDQFIENLPELATEVLHSKVGKKYKFNKEERGFALWILGLTGKGVQNVLGDDTQELEQYRNNYILACHEITDNYENTYGKLEGHLSVGSGVKAQVSWLFMAYFLTTIGAQTLSIRGSDKSTYGKFFEKLILGSLLSILGFEYQSNSQGVRSDGVFWLSSNDQRESDATLLISPGQAVRFDIGFIGRGNSEISMDKITRYQNKTTVGTEQYFSATLIIVDKIGMGSNLTALANQINAPIVQMSGSYWPQRVAKILHDRFKVEHPLVNLPISEVEDYLKASLEKISLDPFLNLTFGKATPAEE